jgi:hypothetical protein
VGCELPPGADVERKASQIAGENHARVSVGERSSDERPRESILDAGSSHQVDDLAGDSVLEGRIEVSKPAAPEPEFEAQWPEHSDADSRAESAAPSELPRRWLRDHSRCSALDVQHQTLCESVRTGFTRRETERKTKRDCESRPHGLHDLRTA